MKNKRVLMDIEPPTRSFVKGEIPGFMIPMLLFPAAVRVVFQYYGVPTGDPLRLLRAAWILKCSLDSIE